MTAAEDAKALRVAARWLNDNPPVGAVFGADACVVAMNDRADEIDPPAPPLPVEPGWYTNLRVRDDSPVRPTLPVQGVLVVNAPAYPGPDPCYLLVDDEAHVSHSVHCSVADTVLTVAASPAPRVLHQGAECPEIGSRWRDKDGDEFTVAGPGQVRWMNNTFFGTDWASWPAFPVTEVVEP